MDETNKKDNHESKDKKFGVIKKLFASNKDKIDRVEFTVHENGKEVKLVAEDLVPIKKANPGGNALFIILDGSNVGNMYKGKIVNGFFEPKNHDGAWFVGAQKAIFIKGMGGFIPLYILRYDSPFPAENIHPIEPHFLESLPPDERNKVPTPMLLKRMLNMVILGGMIKPRKRIGMDGRSMMIGMLLGIVVYWYLHFIGFL